LQSDYADPNTLHNRLADVAKRMQQQKMAGAAANAAAVNGYAGLQNQAAQAAFNPNQANGLQLQQAYQNGSMQQHPNGMQNPLQQNVMHTYPSNGYRQTDNTSYQNGSVPAPLSTHIPPPIGDAGSLMGSSSYASVPGIQQSYSPSSRAIMANGQPALLRNGNQQIHTSGSAWQQPHTGHMVRAGAPVVLLCAHL
jgi:hypothetical protein